jgi:hypothetical protein
MTLSARLEAGDDAPYALEQLRRWGSMQARASSAPEDASRITIHLGEQGIDGPARRNAVVDMKADLRSRQYNVQSFVVAL